MMDIFHEFHAARVNLGPYLRAPPPVPPINQEEESMNLKKAWLVIPAAAALALTACAGGGTSSSGSADKVVTTNGTEPQNPLLPGLTNENGGGKILTVLFSQLVRYDIDGTAVLDVAESIEPNEDASEWTIKLHNDRKFSDGTPVQAHNFIRAWNLITSQN